MVDLRKREFLAELIALPFVARQVDGLGVEERFVEAVQLLLDRLHAAFDLDRSILDLARAELLRKSRARPVWQRQPTSRKIRVVLFSWRAFLSHDSSDSS